MNDLPNSTLGIGRIQTYMLVLWTLIGTQLIRLDCHVVNEVVRIDGILMDMTLCHLDYTGSLFISFFLLSSLKPIHMPVVLFESLLSIRSNNFHLLTLLFFFSPLALCFSFQLQLSLLLIVLLLEAFQLCFGWVRNELIFRVRRLIELLIPNRISFWKFGPKPFSISLFINVFGPTCAGSLAIVVMIKKQLAEAVLWLFKLSRARKFTDSVRNRRRIFHAYISPVSLGSKTHSGNFMFSLWAHSLLGPLLKCILLHICFDLIGLLQWVVLSIDHNSIVEIRFDVGMRYFNGSSESALFW